MRILHVMASAPEGGAEMTMLDCVTALSQSSDIHQYIVTRPNNSWRLSQFSDAGVAYATTNLNPSFTSLSRYKLARIIGRFQPDIIQYWKARAGRFTFSRYRNRSIAWHGATARFSRLSGCDWHLGYTAEVISQLLVEGVDERHLFQVTPFAGGPRIGPVSRDHFGIPENAPLGLVLSRLHAKKGLNTLLEAVRKIAGFHVLIAGDGSMLGALQAQTKALQLHDRVHFLGWRNDKAELLELADFVICPSRIEPFAKVVIEAWAASKPVIAADTIGSSTLITPGKTGVIFRRGDDDALATAINSLIASPDEIKSIGAAGKKAYDAEFGQHLFVEQMLALYERVLSEAGPFAR